MHAAVSLVIMTPSGSISKLLRIVLRLRAPGVFFVIKFLIVFMGVVAYVF